MLTVELLKTLEDVRLASLIEQANNLILWVGSRSDDPTAPWSMPSQEWASVVGGRSEGDAVAYLLRWSSNVGWIDSQYAPSEIGNTNFSVRLTFGGWQRYDDLQRQQVQSHIGFMAMQFNAPEITTVYEQCFKKAAEDAGFGLRILTEAQGAGLIDDQLRVAIRTAKFVIADVSTGNRGADWEAGFAEGLGKPVIYTCREDVLNDKNHEHHPHFDTNHMNTVIWSSGHLEAARRRLAATLRNTFPTEALMPTD